MFFSRFYLGKHSGRQLSLQPSLGSADLNAVFYGSKREESGNGDDDPPVGASASNTSLKGIKKHIIQVRPVFNTCPSNLKLNSNSTYSSSCLNCALKFFA